MSRLCCVIFICFCTVKCSAMLKSEIEDFANFLKQTSQLDQNLKSGSDAEFDEDEPVSDNAWEESGKFEGDLILNDRQRRMIITNVVEGLARNGLTDSTKRWPNNEVIYYIQRDHFTQDQVEAIQSGISDLAQASCVKFTPYQKGDRDAVVIQGSRRGCFSQVGYQGGFQVLNLSGRHPVGRGCFRHGTVIHEMLHTLGFYHMQSSSDRDDYIDVVWENIIKAARHNFRKYNSFAVSDFGVGYDYESVLHYSRKAFSVNGQDTLVPKQSGAGIGQRIGLSQKDTQKLNKMYCDGDSDLVLDSDADKVPIVKKKNTRNKPFQGQGIGYHQGKAVAIKLPAAQTFYLHDPSDIHIVNYFSKAKDTVPAAVIQGIGITKEMRNKNTLSHRPHPEVSIPSIYTLGETISSRNQFSDIIGHQFNPTDAKIDDEQKNMGHNRKQNEKKGNAIQEYSHHRLPVHYMNSYNKPQQPQMEVDVEPNKFYEFKSPQTKYNFVPTSDENVEKSNTGKYDGVPIYNYQSYYPITEENYSTRNLKNINNYAGYLEPKINYEEFYKDLPNTEASNIFKSLRPQNIVHYSTYLHR